MPSFPPHRTFTGRGYHPEAITPERKRWHFQHGAHRVPVTNPRSREQRVQKLPHFQLASSLRVGCANLPHDRARSGLLVTIEDCSCLCKLVPYHFLMILTWLSQYRDIGLLFLRVGIGAMMVIHGWPKLAGGIHEWEKLGKATSAIGINFFPAFWGLSSAMVETIGGMLIVIGWYFRPVTILMTLNFVVATALIYKTNHQFVAWSPPAEMLILFFSLIFIGAGKYSLDRS
jgi:putative oxidoreductase